MGILQVYGQISLLVVDVLSKKSMVNCDEINALSGKSILNSFIKEVIETENYIIEKNSKDNFWYMKSKNEKYYNILSVDTTQMVSNFAKKILNHNFNSILISGLGLGVLPFLCQKTTRIVDVVEIENEVISIVKKIGHLDSNVRIYNQNIYSFIPEIKYDIILFDHWMSFTTEKEMNYLKETFTPHLNFEGIITFPIHEQTMR